MPTLTLPGRCVVSFSVWATTLDELNSVLAPDAPSPVLVAGNPPYTRVQSLPPSQREKARLASGGIIDSGHANLAVLFQAANCRIYGLAMPRAWCCLGHSSTHVRVAVYGAPCGHRIGRSPCTAGPPLLGRSPAVQCRRLSSPSAPSASAGRLSVSLVPSLQTQPSGSSRNGSYRAGGLNHRRTGSGRRAPRAHTTPWALSQIACVRRGSATGANEMFFLTDALARTLPSR